MEPKSYFEHKPKSNKFASAMFCFCSICSGSVLSSLISGEMLCFPFLLFLFCGFLREFWPWFSCPVTPEKARTLGVAEGCSSLLRLAGL
ncbi:hypothetical protein P8452_29743 [Trifolium repens]|nr:hypothetical protein P8452_29743 [Trifolium repens]